MRAVRIGATDPAFCRCLLPCEATKVSIRRLSIRTIYLLSWTGLARGNQPAKLDSRDPRPQISEIRFKAEAFQMRLLRAAAVRILSAFVQASMGGGPTVRKTLVSFANIDDRATLQDH